jgi:hypothetical protein
MKNILLLLLEIVFFVVGGLVVFPLLFVVGVIYSFVKHVFFKFDYSISKQLTPILRSMTLVSDGLACAGAGELLNDFYKIPKDCIVRYGKWYQTISAVTGILKVYVNRDLPLRKSLKILGKNHCEEAITPQEHVYYNIMRKEVK